MRIPQVLLVGVLGIGLLGGCSQPGMAIVLGAQQAAVAESYCFDTTPASGTVFTSTGAGGVGEGACVRGVDY
jgi:hypothetical protein